MKLIPDWRQAWRMFSVQVAGLAIVWGALPVDQQAAILALFGVGPERVPLFIGLAVIVARVVSQQQADASAAAQRAGGPGRVHAGRGRPEDHPERHGGLG